MVIDISNISYLLEKNQIFTIKDRNELKSSIISLIKDYITNNILDISTPNFDNKLALLLFVLLSLFSIILNLFTGLLLKMKSGSMVSFNS